MDTIILLGIFVFTAAYIAAPLIKKGRDEMSLKQSDDAAQDLESEKENLFAAIQEIEFDYQMGKLSSDDFEKINAEYRTHTIDIIQKLDRLQKQSTDDLEEQILKYRKSSHLSTCQICGAKM